MDNESEGDELPESIYSYAYQKDPSIPVDYLFRFLPKELRKQIIKLLTPEEKRALNHKQVDCQMRIVSYIKDMIGELTHFAESQVEVAHGRKALTHDGFQSVNIPMDQKSVSQDTSGTTSVASSVPSGEDTQTAAQAVSAGKDDNPPKNEHSNSPVNPVIPMKPALKRKSSVTRKALLHDENDKRRVIFNPEPQVSIFQKEDDSSRECSEAEEDDDDDETEDHEPDYVDGHASSVITDEARMLPWVDPSSAHSSDLDDSAKKMVQSPSITTDSLLPSSASGDVGVGEPIVSHPPPSESQLRGPSIHSHTEDAFDDNIFAFDEVLDQPSSYSQTREVGPQMDDPTKKAPDVLRRELAERAPDLVSSLPTYQGYDTGKSLPCSLQVRPRFMDDDTSPVHSAWSSLSVSPAVAVGCEPANTNVINSNNSTRNNSNDNSVSMYASSLPIDITFHRKPVETIRQQVEQDEQNPVLTGSPRSFEDKSPEEFPFSPRDVTEGFSVKDMDPGRMSFSQRMLWEEATAGDGRP